MSYFKGCVALCSVLLLPGFSVFGQYSNTSSVVNGFGGRSTGGSYSHVGAGAQPGGIAVSYENGSANYSGGKINRAGFLSTFVLFPHLDTNGNGIPDELDPDNDSDGLWDHWEVSGEKFNPLMPTNPNNPDSDNNGLSDFHEMVAGTNPQDANSAFQIVDIGPSGLNRAVTWNARGNNERIYVVKAINDSFDATPSVVIWSNTVAGGSAPWFGTTQTITDPNTDARFFAVEVIKQ